mgnify:CR=1 FL=1
MDSSKTRTMAGRHHNYQWGKTTNALIDFCNFYDNPPDEDLNQRLEKAFIDQKVFATEKLDGTNVGKDECGQMYGRRCHIGKESTLYLKTSLMKVKQADIAKLKMILCKEVGIGEQNIQKILVYGELMCNTMYDYKERNLVGDWRVFGAMICVRKEIITELFGKLIGTGFTISKDSEEDKIWIYPCSKFFFCVSQCGMETVNVRSSGHSIAQIVSDNLEDMRRGRLEGIMFTTPSSDGCHKVIKWKGAQEYQPSGEQMIKDVFVDIVTKNISNKLKMFYKNLIDVASVGPDTNPLVLKKIHRLEGIKKGKARHGGVVSPEDKKMINLGVYHSMKKFDDIETWLINGSIEAYIMILQDETRKHYVEEKPVVGDKVEDEVVTFINATVAQIVHRFLPIENLNGGSFRQ